MSRFAGLPVGFKPLMQAFRALAAQGRLRGTAFDVFGRTAARREERQLIDDFRAALEAVMARLAALPSPATVDAGIAIARIPEQIRGYGHIKDASIADARIRWKKLIEALDAVKVRAHDAAPVAA